MILAEHGGHHPSIEAFAMIRMSLKMGSYVVTGGARGIGRAIAVRLEAEGHVVVVDVDAEALGWTREHRRISAVTGDAGDEAITARAADVAEAAAPLARAG